MINCLMNRKKEINSFEYKSFYPQLWLYPVLEFPIITNRILSGPWKSITPALHRLFIHSGKLIANNNDCGLETPDESGFGGNNKILRSIRTNISRKNSRTNLVDALS